MTLVDGSKIALFLAVAGLAVYWSNWGNRKEFPIRVRGTDEQRCVREVVVFTARKLGAEKLGQRLASSLKPWGYRTANISYLSKPELDVLAPYIALFIEGKGSPLNLPNGYKDWRPEVLSKFKTRMIHEGLWPT